MRGPVPGFPIRGAWPHGTSRVHGGGLMARAYQEDCARARPSAWVLNSRCVAARDKSRPGRRAMARAHRESCVRARGVVGRGLEKLSHGGSLAGRSASGLVKIPALDGARRCAGVPCQAGRGGNRSGPNCFLVSFAQKLDAKNTGIPVKQRERHFAVILVG